MACLFSFHCEWGSMRWCVGSLLSAAASLSTRSGFLAPAPCVFRRHNGHSLPKGGTSCWVLMAFAAGSLPDCLCHQVSSNIKKTPLLLGCAHVSPLKEIRDSWLLIKLLAITLPPLLDGIPVCTSASTCMVKIAQAFVQLEKCGC